MSSTFIEWKGWGFTSRDGYISGALLLLLEEARRRKAATVTPTLIKIEQEWSQQIAGQIASAGIDPGFDNLLDDDTTTGVVVDILRATLTRIDHDKCRTTPERMNELTGEFFPRGSIEYLGDGKVFELTYERWIIATMLELIRHVQAAGPSKPGSVAHGNIRPISHTPSAAPPDG